MNVSSRHAGRFELIERGPPAVEQPMTLPWSGAKPGRELCIRESGGGESAAHVFAHLVALGADRRSHGDDQVRGGAAEPAGQRFDGHARHAGGQAPPSRVRGRNRAGDAIRNQQRHTVCGLNRQCQ